MASIDRAIAFATADRVPLDRLDDTTLRAMCDAGFLDHASYTAIARTRGLRIVEVSAPIATAGPDRAFAVSLPSHIGIETLGSAVAGLGGRVVAAFDQSAKGALTLPADTRMQHQRPREPHHTSVA